MRITKLAGLAVAIGAVFAGLSCSTDEETARQFPRTDNDAVRKRDFTPIEAFTLDNGIAVYLQEEHTKDRIAIEVFYKAGYIQEPKGLPQLSHLAEHALIFSPTESYGPDEAVNVVSGYGRINAESMGDFVHYDYIVVAERLAEALKIEKERLTSVRIDPEVVKREAERALQEIITSVNSDRPLTRHSLAAFNQIVNYGQKHVPLLGTLESLEGDDLARFQHEHYNVADMVIVIVGNVKLEEAEALVRKHFEPIAPKAPAPSPKPIISGNVDATWDVDAKVGYLTYTDLPEDYKQRVILMMYGSYVSRHFINTSEIYDYTMSTYVTNTVYRLAEMPFFVFVQPNANIKLDIALESIIEQMGVARQNVTEDMVGLLKANISTFMTSTLLKETLPNDTRIDHDRIIGQQAVNIGVKHLFREGRTQEEVLALIDSITYEEFVSTVDEYLDDSRRHTIRIVGK